MAMLNIQRVMNKENIAQTCTNSTQLPEAQTATRLEKSNWTTSQLEKVQSI